MCWQPAEQLAIGALMEPSHSQREGKQGQGNQVLAICAIVVMLFTLLACIWCGDAWQTHFLDPVESNLLVVGLGTTAEYVVA